MITLKDFFTLVNYRITEGGDYYSEGYEHAFCLDSWNGDQNGHSFSIIFNTRTQAVYEVQAHDYRNQRAYRLFNPSKQGLRNVDIFAWDAVAYVDLEVDEDWLAKAEGIRDGRDYDTRVSIPLEFTDEELLKYMTLAHERDMTFNQLVEQALREAIEEFKRDPESLKARVERWKEQNA